MQDKNLQRPFTKNKKMGFEPEHMVYYSVWVQNVVPYNKNGENLPACEIWVYSFNRASWIHTRKTKQELFHNLRTKMKEIMKSIFDNKHSWHNVNNRHRTLITLNGTPGVRRTRARSIYRGEGRR